jgi:hypothetical protein
MSEQDFSLTEEQKKILGEEFSYSDEYEMTEADFDRLIEMFKSPEDFKLLRKILGQHTPNEAGITFKSPHKIIEATLADREAYAIEHAVSMMADERIRQSLLQTYVQIRRKRQERMKVNFEEQNKADFEEGKMTEDFEEKQEEEKRTLGVNL